MENKALRIPLLIVILGALIGLFFSAVLIYEHNGAATSVGSAVCDAANASSCEKAATSTMGKILGFPLALYGFLFYGGMVALAVFLFISLHDTVMRLLYWGAVAALAFDIFLFLYSITILGAVCRLCAVTYAATSIMVIGAFLL
ncbi:MAG TPA: vitamin K epoxide reductase family protein, partial [Turneriella sp.]|nr:vitamin K epoxide reductase family protein [Turneriella sp.]